VGTLSFNFQTVLPLLARFSFHGHAGTYAALTTAMGVGAVAGALIASAREVVGPRLVTGATLAFGALLLADATAPDLAFEVVLLAFTGAASVTFASSVNSSLQLNVRPSMRGRVMALYSVVFLGSNPIGGPLMGWIAGVSSPRVGLLVGAAAALAAGLAARTAFARLLAGDRGTGGEPAGRGWAAAWRRRRELELRPVCEKRLHHDGPCARRAADERAHARVERGHVERPR
jgi:predicted MFS family arabinose efflux permease